MLSMAGEMAGEMAGACQKPSDVQEGEENQECGGCG
jgi:hypothetical protein